MANETQKGKIERLEKELQQKDLKIDELYGIIENLNSVVSEMTEKANKDFENSGDRKQLLDRIFVLEEKLKLKEQQSARQDDVMVKELQEKLERADAVINLQYDETQRLRQQYSVLVSKDRYEALLKKYEELKKQRDDQRVNKPDGKVRNERGAGRKPKVTDQEKKSIRERAASGASIRELSREFQLSIGTVHKIISEQ